MFKDSHAFSGFAVSDISAAKEFYGATLGLDVRDSDPPGSLELHLIDGGHVFIYPKPDHVPATYTMLNLPVADIEAAVDALIAAGVAMARYPGLQADDKGIVRDGQGPAIAWFADPAGNILSVLQLDAG
jgi:catechol 2,3-dioxygenase-like lactoylglutathione lyase family enzyme